MSNIDDYKVHDLGYNKRSDSKESQFFENYISVPEKKNDLLGLLDHFFQKLELICILKSHDYFNEGEAAMFLRLPDPFVKGKDTIRNYALRHKKLSYYKVGRDGLIFKREDLVKFLNHQKSESVYESSFI